MKYRNILFLLLVIFLSLTNQVIAENPGNEFTVTEVIATPEIFHKKNITITGFYHIRFEGLYLYDDKGNKIWLGELSSDADLINIHEVHQSWSKVTGIFFKGSSGHFGIFPGKIDKITSIQPQSGNIFVFSAGYKLEGIIQTSKEIKALFVDPYSNDKAYVVTKGMHFSGVIPKKIIEIFKDRVVIEERCPICTGRKYRNFELILDKKQ